jgi:hypothetical protein
MRLTRRKQAAQKRPELLGKLDGHPDARAALAREELAKQTPDLDAITALATRGDTPDDDDSGRLRQLMAITLPTAEEVIAASEAVTTAEARVAALAGTPAADARRLAGLLSAALDHQRDHVGEPCPVCGGRPLDGAWAQAASEEAARLRR